MHGHCVFAGKVNARSQCVEIESFILNTHLLYIIRMRAHACLSDKLNTKEKQRPILRL